MSLFSYQHSKERLAQFRENENDVIHSAEEWYRYADNLAEGFPETDRDQVIDEFNILTDALMAWCNIIKLTHKDMTTLIDPTPLGEFRDEVKEFSEYISDFDDCPEAQAQELYRYYNRDRVHERQLTLRLCKSVVTEICYATTIRLESTSKKHFLSLDLDIKSLSIHRTGSSTPVKLTPKQWKMFFVLYEAGEEGTTAESLSNTVWAENPPTGVSSFTTLTYELNKKLIDLGLEARSEDKHWSLRDVSVC